MSPARLVVAFGAAILVAAVGGCALAPSSAPSDQPMPTPSETSISEVSLSELYYPSLDGETFGIDACLPDRAGLAPIVVLIHGGSFVGGSKADLADLCSRFAGFGYATFSLDYRLVPWGTFPLQVDDVGSAISWLTEPGRAAELGLAADDVTVIGASAGAIIAAQLASGVAPSPATEVIDRVVLLSGVYDFTQNPALLGADLESVLRGYLACPESGECDALSAASPIGTVGNSTPPTLLIHSDDEFVPLTQADAYAAALEAAAVPHRLITVPGEQHADQILRTQPQLVGEILLFLESD